MTRSIGPVFCPGLDPKRRLEGWGSSDGDGRADSEAPDGSGLSP